MTRVSRRMARRKPNCSCLMTIRPTMGRYTSILSSIIASSNRDSRSTNGAASCLRSQTASTIRARRGNITNLSDKTTSIRCLLCPCWKMQIRMTAWLPKATMTLCCRSTKMRAWQKIWAWKGIIRSRLFNLNLKWVLMKSRMNSAMNLLKLP